MPEMVMEALGLNGLERYRVSEAMVVVGLRTASVVGEASACLGSSGIL